MNNNNGNNTFREHLADLARAVRSLRTPNPELPGMFDLFRHLVSTLSVSLPDLRDLPRLSGYLNATGHLRRIFTEERTQPALAQFTTLLQDVPAMKLASLQPEELQKLSLPPSYLTGRESLAEIVQHQTELFRMLLIEKLDAAAREQRAKGTEDQTRSKKSKP